MQATINNARLSRLFFPALFYFGLFRGFFFRRRSGSSFEFSEDNTVGR